MSMAVSVTETIAVGLMEKQDLDTDMDMDMDTDTFICTTKSGSGMVQQACHAWCVWLLHVSPCLPSFERTIQLSSAV